MTRLHETVPLDPRQPARLETRDADPEHECLQSIHVKGVVCQPKNALKRPYSRSARVARASWKPLNAAAGCTWLPNSSTAPRMNFQTRDRPIIDALDYHLTAC